MDKIKIFLISAFLLSGIYLSAQKTLHLRANASDYLDNYSPNANYANGQEMDAIAWTAGSSFVSRCIFNFNLSSIPANSTVVSAYLSLWGDTNTSNFQGDSHLSGSNAWSIQRVSSAWNVSTVTWNTQPTTDVTNEVKMPQSTSIYEIFNNIDVTNLMQDIINNQPNNYGLLIRLDTEQLYRSMVFCANNYPDTNERPLLVITYAPSGPSTDSCVKLRFTQSDYLDNYSPTANYGTSQELDAIAWTAGSSFISRSVIDFNWDTIPVGAKITSATLSLYGDSNTSNYQGDASSSGSDDWLIQRVTSTWNGNTVNWNTQPTTDTTHQVHMGQSTSIYEDFPSIDVTKLVQDIVDTASKQFGFLWKLNTELIYRSMVFCSDYYPNHARRPALSVCYSIPNGIGEVSNSPKVSIYPNPVNDYINVHYSGTNSGTIYYNLYDITGRQIGDANSVLGRGNSITTTINTSNLSDGMYLLRLIDGNTITNYKFIKE